MPNGMDVHRLIAEVKSRPTLWDVRLPEYKDRTHTVRLWLEIAKNMGCEVEQCKRKWKNLRDAYRAEVRRTERRVQRLKLEGHTDPQVNDSKWVYFQPMSFMNESKRIRYSSNASNAANAANASSNDFSNDSHEPYTPPEATEHIDMDSYCNVKMEPPTSTDDEAELNNDVHCGVAALVDDDDEANDMLFEQFKSVATPQAARRLSGTLTIGTGISLNSPTTIQAQAPAPAAAAVVAPPPTTTTATALAPIASNGNGNGSASGSQVSTCKCGERSEDQVHFLEDLEREEQQLMQSTRRDITRASSLTHFGDSDYNFLVSFLPQMKRLSELQNLQFRAKMSDLMLRIMAQPMATVPAIPSASFGCISTTSPCQQGHFDCTTTTTTTTGITQQQQQQQQQ